MGKGPGEKFCHACGSVIPLGASFCAECGAAQGTRIAPDPSPPPVSPPMPMLEQIREKRVRPGIFLLLAVFLGPLGAHYFYAGRQKAGAANLCATVFSLGLLAPVVWVVAICHGVCLFIFNATSTGPIEPRDWTHYALGAALVILMVVLVGQAQPGRTERIGSGASAERPTGASGPKVWNVGEGFQVGYFAYRVQQSMVVKSVGPFLRAKGSYLVVVLTARNNDSSASTLPPFKLVDASGAEYDETPAMGQTDDAIGFRPINTMEWMNPGSDVGGFIIFDVADPYRAFNLRVSGGYTSGETALAKVRSS